MNPGAHMIYSMPVISGVARDRTHGMPKISAGRSYADMRLRVRKALRGNGISLTRPPKADIIDDVMTRRQAPNDHDPPTPLADVI